MSYTQASIIARMFCFYKETNVHLGKVFNPEHPAAMPLVPQTQAAALLGVFGRSPRSAEAAQSLGRLAVVRAVQLGALSVSLAASAARQELAFQEEVVQRANDDMRLAYTYCPVHFATETTPLCGFVEDPRSPLFGSSQRMGVSLRSDRSLID